MKKFKSIKTMEGFAGEKLTKDEMYQLTGGMRSVSTGSTKSVCHVDGKDDGDDGGSGPIIIIVIRPVIR